MSIIRALKGKGRVKNHSQVSLWVIESDTNDPHGPPIAHILKPSHKSPIDIDADGFKRLDGKPINGHPHWWKIVGRTTADIYDSGDDLRIDIIYKKAVSETEFGEVQYKHSENWGTEIKKIIDASFGKNRTIDRYLLDDEKWVSKEEAILLVENDEIDNAVLVRPKQRKPYIRSRPDKTKANNFSELARR